METRVTVTPWRDREELLDVRRHLFGEDIDARERAVDKICAWRVRKHELPLLLESTADIVHAVVQDERNLLPHNALRLVYATAISRFITGLSDTQTELSRLRPSFFPPQKILQFPLALRETRHCIVHRHLPPLAELKRAAQESLDWLWEWYWSHLDAAFADGASATEVLSKREVRERLQGVLKTYVKARKNEIKSRAKDSRAATSATASYGYLEAPTRVKLRALLGLLVDEKAVLPADKKLGTSMSGAFLIWTPFLLALCRSSPSCLRSLLDAMMGVGSASSRVMVHLEQDPAREAFHDWSVHILSSAEWEDARRQTADPTQSGHGAERRLLDYVLGHTFTIPTFWTLKLAESLLKDEDLSGRVSWLKILEAAKSEDIEMDDQQGTVAPISAEDMDVDITDVALPVLTSTTNNAVAKLRGPQKKVGLWKTQPIGMIPQGWEVDE